MILCVALNITYVPTSSNVVGIGLYRTSTEIAAEGGYK